jgi:hypothetical protein
MRFGHSVAEWTAMVAESGLTVMAAHEIRAPNSTSPCCLIVAAHKR